MPIYEYVCSDCGLKFELLRPLSQANEGASCPHCHNSAKRVFSTFASFAKDESGHVIYRVVSDKKLDDVWKITCMPPA